MQRAERKIKVYINTECFLMLKSDVKEIANVITP